MNILVVENDEILSDLMKALLENRGYNVRVCSSVEDAYLCLDGINILIIDSYLGKEFRFVNLCTSKEIYCIYHTGRMDITDEEYYMFDFVVQKPGFEFLIKHLYVSFEKFEVCV